MLTTPRRSSVLDAIGMMSQANIGALVIAEDERPIGIFTERDYLRKIVLEGPSKELKNNPDVKEFYMGIKEEGVRGKRRWKKRKT